MIVPANLKSPIPEMSLLCRLCGEVSPMTPIPGAFCCAHCFRTSIPSVLFTGTFDGALPNGTRVRKVNSEPDDGHPNGSEGRVLSSIGHPEVMNGKPFYFVEFDANPRIAVGVSSSKVEAIT